MEIRRFRNLSLPCLIFSFLFPSIAFSQNNTAGCDLPFINHLVNSGHYEEALFLLNSNGCSAVMMSDSANYLKGWSLYSLKRLEASSQSLLKVSTASPYYLKSHFFAAYNLTHTGQYSQAAGVLDAMELGTGRDVAVRNFERAGINLLQGNIAAFDSFMDKTDTGFYEITKASDILRKISIDVRDHKKKSPVMAGIMSGIIPGSGKFYAGKKGGGISAFIATAGLGAVSWENYHKSGLSFKTAVFSSAFAVAYVANIYGAVMSVRIMENEYKENVKNTVLFNLHIPLRTVFGQ